MPHTERLLQQAISLAASARRHGNHPFGAVLADADGHVLLTAENTVVTTGDVTGHAETNLVRAASASISVADLRSMALYSSTEPCAMCSGAIYWSGIGTVVYALGEDALREITGVDERNPTLQMPCRTVFAAGQREVIVRGPYSLSSALDVHAGFWESA